jgi:hypothetical protein
LRRERVMHPLKRGLVRIASVYREAVENGIVEKRGHTPHVEARAMMGSFCLALVALASPAEARNIKRGILFPGAANRL